MLRLRSLVLWAGPTLFLLSFFTAPPLSSPEAWRVIALAAWVLLWWVTEVVPIGVTALLPLLCLPTTGALSERACLPPGAQLLQLRFRARGADP